jgi:D-alanine transaminase
MTRTVYVNGRYCAPEEATVSIFDRGLLFADAVYEVAGVFEGRLIDFAGHMSRLARSLREMRIEPPMTDDEILAVMRELVARNEVHEGLVYMQITRGVEERDFVPGEGLAPTVFMLTQEKPRAENTAAETGIAVKSVPDLRWARRDIKTVGLLGQVMAKWAAKDAGCDEAWMIEDGHVTEGGATSAYIVKDGVLVTRPLSTHILAGVTRAALLALAAENTVRIDERLYTIEEAYEADEAFITGASTYVCPVVSIDGRPIGDGTPGPVVRRLQEIYMDFIRRSVI